MLQEDRMLLQEGRKKQIVLRTKMEVPKGDLIKTKNSKAIRKSSRPQKRRRRQQKTGRHSPSK